MKKLIGIVGMPGAGKSIIADTAKKYGIPVIVMGDVIREEAILRRIPPTPENLGKIMKELRLKEGAGVVARRCFPKIDKCKEKVIMIDGIRSLAEVEEFKEKYGEIIIIAVHASPKTRFKRLKKRGRSDDPKNWEEFTKRDLRELEVGIGKVIAIADYMLVNEDTIEKLIEKATKILERLKEDD
ncbi:MAG: AAA family ATPase [archaeon GB-1867-035]|nr:AAA family ATPase [Candidatus Culexmicrobium profundum]